MPRLPIAVGAFLALIGTVVLANYMSAHYGLVPAGFGLLVSAGTYAAGLALGLRDLLDRAGGLSWVLAAIAVGVAVSFLAAGPQLALASATAFALGELADLLVWRRLRASGWRSALILSNIVGALVDTLVFLPLAGFPVTAESVGGQFLVKAVWMTLAALAIGELVTRAATRRPVHA